MVEALRRDYTTAPISEQDRVMLDYVVKLTKTRRSAVRRIIKNCGAWDSTIKGFCKLR